jgi:FKBP-type peptidyl-prolyl cis-trans isomerase 2
MNTALDYFGNEIQVGDTVAFMQTNYRNLMSGVISSITEKNVIIDHEPTNVGKTQTKQFHNQVIVKK